MFKLNFNSYITNSVLILIQTIVVIYYIIIIIILYYIVTIIYYCSKISRRLCYESNRSKIRLFQPFDQLSNLALIKPSWSTFYDQSKSSIFTSILQSDHRGSIFHEMGLLLGYRILVDPLFTEKVHRDAEDWKCE